MKDAPTRTVDLIQQGVLARYPTCPVCSSEDREPVANTSKANRYLRAVCRFSDLTGGEAVELMQAHRCRRCDTQYSDPWFSRTASSQLYNVGFGQHTNGWATLEKSLRGKGSDWQKRAWPEIRSRIGKVHTYAEVNCPLGGLLPYFQMIEQTTSEFRAAYNRASRGLGAPAAYPKRPFNIAQRALWAFRSRGKLGELKDTRPLQGAAVELPASRFLINETSSLCWGPNCIGQGVTCTGLSGALLRAPVLSFSDLERRGTQLDVALVTTIDHFFDPLSILDRLLERTRLVVLYSHLNQQKYTKQHLYAFGLGLLDFLRERGLHVADLRDPIISPEERSTTFCIFVSRQISSI